jgi:hypothetical protein
VRLFVDTTVLLLTLDRGDFGALMDRPFYGLTVLTPGMFLNQERAAGRQITVAGV